MRAPWQTEVFSVNSRGIIKMLQQSHPPPLQPFASPKTPIPPIPPNSRPPAIEITADGVKTIGKFTNFDRLEIGELIFDVYSEPPAGTVRDLRPCCIACLRGDHEHSEITEQDQQCDCRCHQAAV
jgi:hypothetical protein